MLNPENHLRLAIAMAGTAAALFAVARAGSWPRLLYLLGVGYFAYFAAASAWRDLWQVATVPAEGAAETFALTLELAMRLGARYFASERYGLAFAHAYDLVVMPLAQLVATLFLARTMLQAR